MDATLARLVAGIDPKLVPDLLEEAGQRNHLEVGVYRRIPGPAVRRKQTMKEQFDVQAFVPELLRQDRLRSLAGLKPKLLLEALRRRGGELVGVYPNLRTNIGADFVAAQLSGTSVAVADYIALSANAGGASATHASTAAPWSTAQTTDGTTGEFTTFAGLARKQATYAHTVSGPSSLTNTYTLSATWTLSATVTSSIQLAGLFGGSAKTAQGGTNTTNMLVLESAFTGTTGASGDQLVLTWTVTV